MTRSVIASEIMESLGKRLDHWSVEASQDEQLRWVVALTHPASAGLIVETGATEEEQAVAIVSQFLASNVEIDVASAAPDLEHADLVSGVRNVASAFDWANQEVRAVAFLMFEHGHLSLAETSWLAGYEGAGAPMTVVSPLG